KAYVTERRRGALPACRSAATVPLRSGARRRLRRIRPAARRDPLPGSLLWNSSGLRRLGNAGIALPSLILELDSLDHDRIGAGVELRKRLIFRDPAIDNLVRKQLLPCLVEDMDDDVFAEALERHRRVALKVVDLVRPVLEREVVRDPCGQREGVVDRKRRAQN